MLSRRQKVLLTLPALYVGVAATRAGEDVATTWLAVAAAVFVVLVAARPQTPEEQRARGITAGALSIAIASVALVEHPLWVVIGRAIAGLAGAVVAIQSVSDIEADTGLAAQASEIASRETIPARALRWTTLALVSVVWGFAAIAPAIGWIARGSAPTLAAACAALSLCILGGHALLTSATRRLELAAPPRALACAGAVGTCAVLGATLAFTGQTEAPDAGLTLAATLAPVAIVRLARASDPTTLARRGRRTLTLVVFGGPIVALVALAAEGGLHGGIAFVLAGVAMLVGALASKLEEPFLPVKGLLLEGLADARTLAQDRHGRAAISEALLRLRTATAFHDTTPSVSPELWLLHPTRVITVDSAGYLQERTAELPTNLLDVALAEPFGTLRVHVLRALEVRQASLRPLLGWLESRGALFATVIAESDAPDGILIVPAGERTEPVTIEEVRAAKRLADAFVATSQTASAYERHLQRERELQDRLDALDDVNARLKHAIDLDVGRNVLATTRLARPATVGIYSAASRMAYEALERRVMRDAPVVVIAPAGVDTVPYVARAHLTGPRREAPLVVVDGTSSREHDVARWRDPSRSPLALADRGLLLLVDGAALPRDVQVLIARAVAERRPPWERAAPLDVVPALAMTSRPSELMESGRLASELAGRFEDGSEIEIPGLAERAEDLRSIIADRLAREGLRVHGRPIGIDAAAFSRLVDYRFEGEDAELASIVTRLVARVNGDIVRAADVDALGLGGDSHGAAAADAR